MKVIVHGTDAHSKGYIANCPSNEQIVAVCDNNWEQIGTVRGYKVISPERIPDIEFDSAIIAIGHGPKEGLDAVFARHRQLNELGVDDARIILHNHTYSGTECKPKYKYPRVQYLYDFAENVYEYQIEGAVAECGVYLGDYASHINKAFPDRTLYLFDTFENFAENPQLAQEDARVQSYISNTENRPAAYTHEDIAMLKCRFRDNVIIKKGLVPETFEGINEDKFVYVHLDMDIYAPTIAGLRFFAPRMSKGGIIALHNMGRNDLFTGVRKAVNEFCNNKLTNAIPIGDGSSLVLLF